MSLVPIYTPGWRETKWSQVSCLSGRARLEPQTSRPGVQGVNCSARRLHFLWKKPGAMFIVVIGNPLVTALSQKGKSRKRILKTYKFPCSADEGDYYIHPHSSLSFHLPPFPISILDMSPHHLVDAMTNLPDWLYLELGMGPFHVLLIWNFSSHSHPL